MGKQTFTNEFKQGVVNYVLDHPDESNLAVAKQFSIANSIIVHKWFKEANNNGTINSRGVAIILVMKVKKQPDLKRTKRYTGCFRCLKKAIGILGK